MPEHVTAEERRRLLSEQPATVWTPECRDTFTLEE